MTRSRSGGSAATRGEVTRLSCGGRGCITVDKVGELTVFDIGGNKYRLIAYIRFEKQIVYIKVVLTHRGYDKGAWKS